MGKGEIRWVCVSYAINGKLVQKLLGPYLGYEGFITNMIINKY